MKYSPLPQKTMDWLRTEEIIHEGGSAGGQRRWHGWSSPHHEAAVSTIVQEGIHSARIQQWHMLPVPDQVLAKLENQLERQQFEEIV